MVNEGTIRRLRGLTDSDNHLSLSSRKRSIKVLRKRVSIIPADGRIPEFDLTFREILIVFKHTGEVLEIEKDIVNTREIKKGY